MTEEELQSGIDRATDISDDGKYTLDEYGMKVLLLKLINQQAMYMRYVSKNLIEINKTIRSISKLLGKQEEK